MRCALLAWLRSRRRAEAEALGTRGSDTLRVVPRALTLGVYLDALIAAGVDDGEPWDAASAPADVCLAVLDALCESVVLPPDGEAEDGFSGLIREQAGVAWGRLEAARARAGATAHRLRLAVEEAVGEGLHPQPTPGRYALLRALSRLPAADRAAAMAEPLARSLVLAEAGAVVRQAEEAERKALETAQRSGGAGRSGRF